MSTIINIGYDINGEIIIAGDPTKDARKLTSDELQELYDAHLKKVQSMSPKDFFEQMCNIFAVDPARSSGWMVAHQLDMGEVRVLNKNGHLGWGKLEDALRNPEDFIYETDPQLYGKDEYRDLPDGDFWLSVEEARGNVPVFLARAGENGPLVNIGSALKHHDTDLVDEMTTFGPSEDINNDMPDGIFRDMFELLDESGNPSVTNDRINEDEFRLDFNMDDFKDFLEKHAPKAADKIDWNGQGPKP